MKKKKNYKCGYFRKNTFWCVLSKICSFSSTFVLHLSSKLHYATLFSKETILSSSNPSITADVPTRPPKSRFMCRDHRFALQLHFHFYSSTFVWALPTSFLKHFHFTIPIPLGRTSPDLSDSVLLDVHASINFFDFPDYLLFEDGQDSIFFSYLFKHHPTVKFIADLLEIVPRKKGTEVEVQSYNLWFCAQQSAFRISE